MVVPKCPSCGGTSFTHIDRSHGDERYYMVCCSGCGTVVGTFR